MPALADDYFNKTVTYICEHNDEGAMGLIINMPVNITLHDLLKQIEENEFDKLWKVLSETDYDRQRELANREGKQYEWWKDEPKHPDEGFDY